MTLPQLELFSLDVERSAPFENDVELVGSVDALMVRLRRDKRIDADLKPRRLMDDLETSCFGAAEACSGPVDVERVSRIRRCVRFVRHLKRASRSLLGSRG